MELRPITEHDLEFVLEVRNDISTRSFLENDREFTLDQAKIWFNLQQPKWFIIIKDEQRVGYVRTSSHDGRLYIGVDIHHSYRRRGLAKQAYLLLLQQGKRFFLWVFEDNFAKQFYEKMGFVDTGNSKIVRDRNYIEMKYAVD